jgi:coenzyme F420-0:L-glutamate ligase/coenzyme F420-1:gamma-L-glutamate ligase
VNILDNSNDILRCQEGLIITESLHGFVCANSGIDNSNCEEGYVTPLPVNPDESARKIKAYLDSKFNVNSKIIISDTQGRAWRVGAIGVAIGISGLHPCTDFRGTHDLYGQELMSTIEGTADELASAASLLMGQSDSGICLVLIRGYDSSLTECSLNEAGINEIIREKEQDAFRK